MSDYFLGSEAGLLTNDTGAASLIRDISGPRPTSRDIDSLVASGDLFAVLATELDEVNLTLSRSPSSDVSSKLDKLTEILLYLQRYYQVGHKD